VDTTPYWTVTQPGLLFTDAEPGSERFYREVTRHRYSLEAHILEMVPFAEARGKDVLDVGCGIGTDGARFAEAGARYTGVDQSEVALALAQRRFDLDGIDGTFVQADATALPFGDESFDLVYSHGVIHHISDTDTAVAEFHRVLRPGGTAIVMVYHRGSLNYRFNILVVRRALAAALAIPGAERALGRIGGGHSSVIAGHKQLLREHGLRYLTDTALFLSNNTDGPGNPLSKVYSRSEARALFHSFARVETGVRYLNLRLYPKGERLAATVVARRLAGRCGWHLYVRAQR